MIKTALVALTVIGCDCDARLCEYVGETPGRWASIAECEASLRAEIATHRELDYPLVSGVCRLVEPAPEAVAIGPDAGDRFDTRMNRSLYEKVTSGPYALFEKTADGYRGARDGVLSASGTAFAAVRRSVASLPSYLPGF